MAKKKRVSFSERILLPTVCAQKALLQPGFSGVKKEAGATAPTPAPAVAAPGFPTPAVLSGEWWVGVENGAPARGAPGPSSPSTKGFSDTWTPQRFASRPSAPAPGPGRRRRDRSLSHTPPRRSSCPRRLSGAEPRGSRSFQPGPHFSQAGPEWATRAGESRPETLLQKRPARERPPALLHTNHAGDARASPAGPPPRSRLRSRRGAAHVLREHAPYNQGTLQNGPSQLSGTRTTADPRASRVTRGRLRKPRPHVATRTKARPSWLLPGPAQSESYRNGAEKCFHMGRGFTFS